ncbi:MAG: RICIN domain-containing protein, partial [Ruminococcus sp.]
GGAGKSNQAVIAVYDTYNASGTVSSDPFLSFRVTSGAYSGFEIESCDISSDGQMYFNVNRWTSSSGNYDAILRFNGFVANGFNPDGNVDVISGGQGSVYVRGWAFDKDCAAMNIPVHVYIGGPAGSGEGHAITANTYRNDVNGAFGCGDYHGFDATIGTSLRGSQPVYLYAINTRKGTNVMIGSGWVNITSDTSAPSIGNVRVTEVSENGYRVTCDVWDDTGVTSVRFPTWTTNNGQDDLIWHEGSVSGNTATCYISRNDHWGEYGTYITHIYAYDGYGNQSCNGDTNVYLEQPLSIYNYGIVDIGADFYANITGLGKNLSINGWDGTNVIISDKDGSTPQNWHFIRQSNGSYKIVNMYNNKCLDVSGAANADGANVQLWEDNDSSAQRWYIYNVNGKYALKAECSDRVIDITGGSSANGTNIQTYTFNNSGAQLFEINKSMTTANLGDDFYANISCYGKNLSINGWDGDNVILYDKDGSTPQNWHFIRQGDGSYKIVNMYNNKCLDVSGASSSNNANVGIFDDNNGTSQRWYIYSTVDGKYVLMSGCSSCVLDVCGASSENGANIMMGTSHGGANQQFTIEPAVNCATITYSGHVQNIGDVAPVSNWEVLGTTGQALRLEGVRMSVNGMSGDVQYRVHVQNYGWMDWKSANEYAGTTGESLRIEAIEIKLTGEIAEYYNVEYQSAVQDIGWMSVCRNGETSGTTGQALRLEAIKVRLVHK